jgi:hypothetical protein
MLEDFLFFLSFLVCDVLAGLSFALLSATDVVGRSISEVWAINSAGFRMMEADVNPAKIF